MPHSHPKIHKNVSILSDHILALNSLEKISNKPEPMSRPILNRVWKKWSPKLIRKKRISKRVRNKWSTKLKENGNKENSKLKKLLINNLESLKMSLPPSQKDGRKLNKSLMKFMKLPDKKYMKWLLHKLNKKLIKQNKTSKKEQETLNKVPKMPEEMSKESIKRENMKLKKQLECNHKKLFMKMSRKLLLKTGKTWNKVLKMFMRKQPKKWVKLLALMLKVKLSKPNNNSNKVLKRQSNHSKKQPNLKNPQLSKQRKNSNNGLVQMPRARHKMLNNILSKELKMLSKVQRKQLVIKVLSFSKPNKTSPKDGRTLRKRPKIHTIRQQRNWVTLGVQYKKQLDKKLNRQAKLWKRRVTRCNRTLESYDCMRMILKILYKKIRFKDYYKKLWEIKIAWFY